MNVEIVGRNLNITAGLRAFTEDRLGRLERVLDRPIEAHVVLWIEKRRHVAEIQVRSPNSNLSGSEETNDLYLSIGEVVDKLERQALKHKEKIQDHRHRKGHRDPESAADIEARARRLSGDEDPATPQVPRVIRSRRGRLKPMSVEDALLEFEATDDEVIVFRDSSTERMSVMFRRGDGNIGLIDPEA